jgi:peptidoglycan/LPS O-acetylase OafA/YrhL
VSIPQSTAAQPRAHDPVIDYVKGIAALGVIAIHAEVLAGRWLMVHVLNHAVPIFVVLFGMNAERWWRERGEASAAAWYRGRARRFYPPLWSATLLWCALVLPMRPDLLHPRLAFVVCNVTGIKPSLGAGWYVTVLLQLLLLQPLLHRLARRGGTGLVVAVGLACLTTTVALRSSLLATLGLWGYLVLAPRLLTEVAFGMWLAPRLSRCGGRVLVVAVLATVCCASVQTALEPQPLATYPERLVDLPLTVALLIACRPLARRRAIVVPLAWLGVNSYGLYLAQAVVHDVAIYRLGIGIGGPSLHYGPWPYAAFLLATAVVLVAGGNALRPWLAALADRLRGGVARSDVAVRSA